MLYTCDVSCMYISYGLEALYDYEDLRKTLYRLNKQLCTAGVLLITQCDHVYTDLFQVN